MVAVDFNPRERGAPAGTGCPPRNPPRGGGMNRGRGRAEVVAPLRGAGGLVKRWSVG
jgi:hypothetical protein